MQNRRNLYRLLHVQHDAPTAIIKNSYRTLMQTLRHHPDLGGDDWNAQLLNEAVATLCDPAARADYDRELGTVLPTRLGRGASVGPTFTSGSPGAPGCPFCSAPVTISSLPDNRYADALRCVRCGGPARAPAIVLDVHDGDERRRIDRRVHTGVASLRHRWPDDVRIAGTLLDFSVSGCTLECAEAIGGGERVLLEASVLTAIGVVRHCTRLKRPLRHLIGLEFLTLETHAAPGQLFSASA